MTEKPVTLGLLATASYAYEGTQANLAESTRAATVEAAARLEEALGDEVVLVGPIASVEEGWKGGEVLAEANPYAVVVLPTIATMAAYPWAALELLDVPVVVWSRTEATPAPMNTSELVHGSAPVGSAAICNVLMREDRPFRVSSGPEISRRAVDFLEGARLAEALRGATFAHFGGDVWPGMLDVTLDRDAFRRVFGASVVDLEPEYDALPAEVPPGVEVGDVEVEALARSLAVAGGVQAACEHRGISAGSVHCHGSAFAQNPDVGVVCCAAVNALTAKGIPFACTGDDCTAVALFLAQAVAGASQYLELDAPNERLDACLVTSGGEGDLSLAREDVPVVLVGNRFFSGIAGRGAALDFVLAPGPVTLIAFSPTPAGFRVILTGAEVLDDLPPPLGVPRAYVRFPGSSAHEGFERWCEAGANHHLALAPGNHVEAICAFAELTGIEAIVP